MSTQGQRTPTIEDMAALRKFIGACQYQAMRECAADFDSGERGYFLDKFAEFGQRVATMPKVYEQDGLGDSAVAHLHYFSANGDWWITERDLSAVQHQAFGLATINGVPAELGYVSILELIQNGVELDLHWTPKTLHEIKAGSALSAQGSAAQ